MGILNITPDSFSDGGKYFSIDDAIDQGLKLIENGAEIIDIGGESTRPGSESVSIEEELRRVIPVIHAILKRAPEIKISVDTTKSKVAEEAIKSGAHIVNDVSAGNFDQNMMNVCAKFNVPYIIMHMKGTPKNMQDNPSYKDTIEEIKKFFENKIAEAEKNGINNLILDPGIGFGKRIEDNYKILANLESFKEFKLPILIGLSKKSFLGKSLNIDIENRENATIISETISVLSGANIIRTHNVKNAVELKKIMNHFKNYN